MGEINKRVFALLKEKDLKAKDLADFIGSTEQTVSNWKKEGQTQKRAIWLK